MYAKIFAQIYDGTLCTNGPWEALVTFQQLLVLADEEGCVDMTASAIARRTTIPLEIIEKGIKRLLEPDPESRTPTAEGRRIVPLSEGRAWGWQVVNYKHYRQIKREQDRREYHRDYWINKRSKKSTDSTPTQHAQPSQPIAEAEAEAEAEAGKTKTARKRAAPAVLVSLPDLVAEGVDEQHATDWLVARKAKGLPLTPTAWAETKAEAVKAGMTPGEAIKTAAGNGWGGFKASWLHEQGRAGPAPSAHERKAAEAAKWIPKTPMPDFDFVDMEDTNAAPLALR